MYKVPLSNYPNQKFSTAIPINGENVYLRFSMWYNYEAGYWLVTIQDQKTEKDIISNIPLLSSTFDFSNFLRQFGYKMIGKAYIGPINDTTLSMPNNENISTDFVLLWGDNDE